MALIRDRIAQLRSLREGKISAGSKEGQDIIIQAFKEDHVMALNMVEGVNKDFLARGMKLAGFNTAEVGHMLFKDPTDRAKFFAQEQQRSQRIGSPGHDDLGYPIGFNGGDPFGDVPTKDMMARIDPSIEDEDDHLRLDLLKGPRPS